MGKKSGRKQEDPIRAGEGFDEQQPSPKKSKTSDSAVVASLSDQEYESLAVQLKAEVTKSKPKTKIVREFLMDKTFTEMDNRGTAQSGRCD